MQIFWTQLCELTYDRVHTIHTYTQPNERTHARHARTCTSPARSVSEHIFVFVRQSSSSSSAATGSQAFLSSSSSSCSLSILFYFYWTWTLNTDYIVNNYSKYTIDFPPLNWTKTATGKIHAKSCIRVFLISPYARSSSAQPPPMHLTSTTILHSMRSFVMRLLEMQSYYNSYTQRDRPRIQAMAERLCVAKSKAETGQSNAIGAVQLQTLISYVLDNISPHLPTGIAHWQTCIFTDVIRTHFCCIKWHEMNDGPARIRDYGKSLTVTQFDPDNKKLGRH